MANLAHNQCCTRPLGPRAGAGPARPAPRPAPRPNQGVR